MTRPPGNRQRLERREIPRSPIRQIVHKRLIRRGQAANDAASVAVREPAGTVSAASAHLPRSAGDTAPRNSSGTAGSPIERTSKNVRQGVPPRRMRAVSAAGRRLVAALLILAGARPAAAQQPGWRYWTPA